LIYDFRFMILDYLISYCFFGFGIYTIVFLVLKRYSSFKEKTVFLKFDNAALTTVIIAGIIYLLLWIYHIIYFYQNANPEDIHNFQNRISGKYWYGYWFQPLSYVIASQLLWFKHFQISTFFRLILGLLLLFNVEKFVIFITSLQRDYLPSSWSMYSDDIFGILFLDGFLKTLIFVFFAVIVYFLKNKISVNLKRKKLLI